MPSGMEVDKIDTRSCGCDLPNIHDFHGFRHVLWHENIDNFRRGHADELLHFTVPRELLWCDLPSFHDFHDFRSVPWHADIHTFLTFRRGNADNLLHHRPANSHRATICPTRTNFARNRVIFSLSLYEPWRSKSLSRAEPCDRRTECRSVCLSLPVDVSIGPTLRSDFHKCRSILVLRAEDFGYGGPESDVTTTGTDGSQRLDIDGTSGEVEDAVAQKNQIALAPVLEQGDMMAMTPLLR